MLIHCSGYIALRLGMRPISIPNAHAYARELETVSQKSNCLVALCDDSGAYGWPIIPDDAPTPENKRKPLRA